MYLRDRIITRTRIDFTRTTYYYNSAMEVHLKCQKKPREMEKIILADGWVLKSQEGSHRHYSHPAKPGKVTIPFHCKDIPKGTENSILKQAGLK